VKRLRDRMNLLSPAVVGLGLSLLLAAFVGFILAGQILSPSKRIIEGMMAIAVLVAAFLMPSRYSIAFLLFVIPFPQYTTIGSTTVIFAFIIFAFWLLRVAIGYERRPTLSGIEVPLLFLLLLLILSFVMVEEQYWALAVAKFRIFICSVLVFFLVVNLIRTERDIQFVLNALIGSFCFVAAVAMIEIWFPQFAHFFDLIHVKSKDALTLQGVRVGSVFGDYEMFAEYLAIFVPVLLLRLLNERQVLRQLIWIPLLLIAVMLLLATATRGAFISLVAGIGYLIWIARKIVNYQKLLPIMIVVSLMFYGSSLLLNQYTATASLFGRLGKTKLVRGMPDTRAQRWTEAWGMIRQSPWIGHGPYYFVGVDEKNVDRRYPHSLFLFLSYLIGIPGALVFYWILALALLTSLKAARRYANQRTELAYTVVLLSSILVIFFVDEIKISFLRYDNTQQFTWTMLGMLIASSRVALLRADEQEKEERDRIADQ